MPRPGNYESVLRQDDNPEKMAWMKGEEKRKADEEPEAEH